MNVWPKLLAEDGGQVQFTVGLKLNGKTDHIAVYAEARSLPLLRARPNNPKR